MNLGALRVQWLSKNTVIVVLSVSLVSSLLIKNEIKVSDNIEDKRIFIQHDASFVPSNTNHKSNESNKKSKWSDSQLVAQLKNKDSLLILQALSHIWIDIGNYKKHNKIMEHVRYLARENTDNRISGMASLVSGESVQQVDLVKSMATSIDEWERLEQQELVWQENQSESDDENLEIPDSETLQNDTIYHEDRVQYVNNLISLRDDSKVSELSTLIFDEDEEVSVAAIDALILNLEQGIGDPAEIESVLEENIAYLDELQIQTFKQLSGEIVLEDQKYEE